jgi:hypothetical protein
MDTNILDILKRSQNDPKLGAVISKALQFIGDSEYKILQTPGPGQTSSSVVRMYQIRMGLPKFKREAFIGLDESILRLGEREVTVHLSVVEMEKGLVSVWLTDGSSPPIGVVISEYA